MDVSTKQKNQKLFDNIFISLFGVDGLILNKFLNVKKLKINKLKNSNLHLDLHLVLVVILEYRK